MCDHDAVAEGGGPGRPGGAGDEALARLMAGHERYLRGESRLAALQPGALPELARGQRPYATILGCSDSRVPPELIFDAGLGDLFVVRVAGNVLSGEVAGSLQYAGVHLRTPLFVVIGHENCGAVKAALEQWHEGARHLSRIQLLVDSILPALAEVEPGLPEEQRLSRAVEANVRRTVRGIRESPEGQARIREGDYRLLGAIYEIASGRLRFLDDTDPRGR